MGSASPEPGIIYLMDDTNNNGEPDDVWYEVKGSEFNSNSYRRNYSLTYYRPKSQTDNVTWSDKDGIVGELPNSSKWWWNNDKESTVSTACHLIDYGNGLGSQQEVVDNLI